MRWSKNRLDVDRLFVLGAGASYAASSGPRGEELTTSPLDKDFVSRILDLNDVYPKWVGNAVTRWSDAWCGNGALYKHGLEEAIIDRMQSYDFIRAIHPRRRKNEHLENSEYLNLSSHLIAFLLNKSREHRTGTYRKLCSRLFPTKLAYDQIKDRVITFNYDCMLDQHLLRNRKPREIYFDKIQRDPSIRRQRERTYPDPLLIKLHGSCNWRCNTDDFLGILNGTTASKGLQKINPLWLDDGRPPSPEDSVSPCIIPPIPSKPITSISIFQFLWVTAYEYLHEAREIIICGYSLPQADSLAYSLFRNFSNKRLERVVVIDPNTEMLTKWNSLLSREGVPDPEWVYASDFGGYVESL